jgi:DNA-binding transcriptional MerR regulator
MEKLISTKEIAKEYGLSYARVNNYVAMGVLPVVRRDGIKRWHERTEIKRRMEKIIELMNKGYTLSSIRDQFEGENKK